MYTHAYRHRVRYRECDPMGVVYHTHYLDYFEAARTEALREVGLPYKAVEDKGFAMPVVDVAVQYHKPATYDDLLVIDTRIKKIPTLRVPFDYMVHREGESDVLVSGRVTLCMVKQGGGRPIRLPAFARDAFKRALQTS